MLETILRALEHQGGQNNPQGLSLTSSTGGIPCEQRFLRSTFLGRSKGPLLTGYTCTVPVGKCSPEKRLGLYTLQLGTSKTSFSFGHGQMAEILFPKLVLFGDSITQVSVTYSESNERFNQKLGSLSAVTRTASQIKFYLAFDHLLQQISKSAT